MILRNGILANFQVLLEDLQNKLGSVMMLLHCIKSHTIQMNQRGKGLSIKVSRILH